MKPVLYFSDLPADFPFAKTIAVDTETMGLNLPRDRLCLVQLSTGDGSAHLVQISADQTSAPELKKRLEHPDTTALFHFARFDLAALQSRLCIVPSHVYCTKIASRLCRTFTDKHSLKDLVKEILGLELNKQQQSSDWGSHKLTEEQMHYAASDVLYLHQLREALDKMLVREGRLELAQSVFKALPMRVNLDLQGWQNDDIFAH